MEESPARACAYYRVSTARQAEKDLSIPDQQRQVRDYCRARGLDLVREFTEPGASATDDNRPGLQEMMDFARDPANAVDLVVVHSFSRFMRDAFLLEFHLRQLARAGVKVVSITQEIGDDPTSQLIRKVIALFDEYASKENAKHVLRAMKQNAREGFWNGSRPPFGYRTVVAETRGDKAKKVLEVYPEEAAVVRDIFSLYLGDGTGQSLGVTALADHLNRRGIRLRGRRFHVSNVHDILTRTAYVGRHHFNRKDSRTGRPKPPSEWITIAVPPLIDEAAFNRVQAALRARNPRKTPPRVVSGPTLLTGVARCADCGGGMTLRTGKGGRYRYYTCAARARMGRTACRGRSVRLDYLDTLVLEQLAERLFTPERLKELLAEFIDRAAEGEAARRQKLKQQRLRLSEIEAGIARLFRAIEAGTIELDDPILTERLSQLRLQKDETSDAIRLIESQMRTANRQITPEKLDRFAARMRETLRNGDPQFKKAYIRLFVERIEVDDGEIRISGTKDALARGLDAKPPKDLAQVRTFEREWRTRQDSNL